MVAYEPNPTLSSELAEKFDDDIWVKVETIALSRCKGTAALHIPMIDGKDVAGLASIDDIHPILNAEEHEIAVSTSALDDNFSGDVGFIKIDVEGHEVAVLEGAQTTIARCRPNALVELEERHAAGAVGRAHRYFAGLNYRGYSSGTDRSSRSSNSTRQRCSDHRISPGWTSAARTRSHLPIPTISCLFRPSSPTSWSAGSPTRFTLTNGDELPSPAITLHSTRQAMAQVDTGRFDQTTGHQRYRQSDDECGSNNGEQRDRPGQLVEHMYPLFEKADRQDRSEMIDIDAIADLPQPSRGPD